MKKNLITIMLCLTAICAGSQTFIQVPIPGRTNQWWTNSPPQSSVVGWEAWAAQNENWTRAGTAFGSLADAHTNSALNSPIRTAYSSNSVTVPLNGSITLPWNVTNYAGCRWEQSSGNAAVLSISGDGGATWIPGGSRFLTNGVVKLKFTQHEAPSVFTAPVDAVLTNLVVYVLERPDLFGRTNSHYGQSVRVSSPVNGDDAASKDYVDQKIATTQFWNAQTNVHINGHAVDLSDVWRLQAKTNATAHEVSFAFLGNPLMVLSEGNPVRANGGSIALDGSNFKVSIPTNGLSGSPKLQTTHYLQYPEWTWVDTSPVVTGTNYVFTFSPPYPDCSFYMAVVPSASPGVVVMKQLLQLTPMDIPATNSTTWGYGAGLVVPNVAGTYLQVSIGTNHWRRSPLGGW